MLVGLIQCLPFRGDFKGIQFLKLMPKDYFLSAVL